MESADPAARVLIIGVGNEMRGDDALGILAVQELRRSVPEGVDCVERDGEGGELIETWRNYQRVILIDAFSSGAIPGMLHCCDVSITRIPPQFFRYSSHSFGVGHAVEIARRLQLLPQEFTIYGIEAKSFKAGEPLSQPVRSRMPELLESVILKTHALLVAHPGHEHRYTEEAQ